MADLSSIPPTIPITVRRGHAKSFTARFFVAGSTTEPEDQSAYVPAFRVRAAEDGEILLQLLLGSGITLQGDDNNEFLVELTVAQIEAFEAGIYVYEFVRTLALVTTGIMGGPFRVRGAV